MKKMKASVGQSIQRKAEDSTEGMWYNSMGRGKVNRHVENETANSNCKDISLT